MKNTSVKTISLSAALCLLLCTVLASCGEAASGGTGTTVALDTGTDLTETTVAVTQGIDEKLPERDYNGYEFHIIATDEVGSIRYSDEIDAAEENGEPLNDAVYRRNLSVEDRFNVKIEKIDYNKSSFVSAFRNAVMAGDNTYDTLVATYDSVIPSGHLYGYDIKDLPYVDLDDPWWDGDFLRETEINGHIWGLTGDINVVDNAATWAMAFNKPLAEQFCSQNIYDVVRKGDWTIEKFKEYCTNVTADLNGNNEYDYDDRYGMVASSNIAVEFIWSSDSRLSKKSKDGVEFTLDSEKNVSILQKVFEFYNTDAVLVAELMTAKDGMTIWEIQRKIFLEGRALFYGITIGNTEYFRDMQQDFGLIPMPKYDKAQTDYCCSAQEWCGTMFMIPKNAPDPERTGIILDAMSSAAVSTVTPAYFENLFKGKLIRDEESVEMLELIFASRVYDPAYTFNWGSLRSSLTGIFKTSSDTVASTIASIKSPVLAAYDTLIKAYGE